MEAGGLNASPCGLKPAAAAGVGNPVPALGPNDGCGSAAVAETTPAAGCVVVAAVVVALATDGAASSGPELVGPARIGEPSRPESAPG